MTIAKRVRDLRYAKGWGPDELASRAEISRTALYQIECGKTETPRAGTLKRIARALDVSIEALLLSEEGGTVDLSHFAHEEEHLSVPASANELGMEPSESDPHHDHSFSYGNGNGPGRPRVVARLHPSREAELHRKFHELLASPLAESIARLVEETFRMLPQSRVKHPV